MKGKTKLMAMLLSVIMVFAMAPCMAFANQDNAYQDAVDQYGLGSFDPEQPASFFQDYDNGSTLADEEHALVPVKINFGTKHKAMAKTVYMKLKEMIANSSPEMRSPAPKIKGAVITLYGNLPVQYVGTATSELIRMCGYETDENGYILDAGEYYMGFASEKSISKFNNFFEYMYYLNDLGEQWVKKNHTYNLYWFKPANVKMDITVDAPICGTEVTPVSPPNPHGLPEQNNGPVVSIPDSSFIHLAFTQKHSTWPSADITIVGGESYTASIPVATKFGYVINDYSNISINGVPIDVASPAISGPYKGMFNVGLIPLTADHAWDKGTSNGDGTFTYECTHCHATKTEEPQKAADGTDLGKGASVQAADAAITGMTEDTDLAGTAFDPLKLRSTKQAKTTATLKWQAVGGAASYLVYGGKCGNENKMECLGEVTAPTYVAKTLTKGTYHKFMVVALGANNKVLASSRLIHVGTKGGKTGNYKSVTIKVKKGKKFKKASAATVDVGSALQTKVALKKAQKKLKKHVGVRYESSDAAIATVDESGVITGVAPGECTITAYAQNGVYKVLKLTVK